MNKNKFLIIGISLMLFLLTWKLYLTSEIKNPIQEFQLEMEMIGHDALSASVKKQTYILLDVVVPLIILVLVGLSFFMYYKNRKN